MNNEVEGIILNEDGPRTLPDKIFNAIGKDIVGSYKWRIHYVEQFGILDDLEDPDKIFDGKVLVKRIEEDPGAQWVWGYFQAFPKDTPDEKILEEPVIDLEDMDFIKQFYTLPVHLVSNYSVLEIECTDSSDTIVRTADEEILSKLKEQYPKWESFEEWRNKNGII